MWTLRLVTRIETDDENIMDETIDIVSKITEKSGRYITQFSCTKFLFEDNEFDPDEEGADDDI